MSGSVGGVDASIPLRAGQGVPANPLTSNPQGFINTLQGVNQLKLFPLEQQRLQTSIQQQQIAVQQQQTALQTAQLGQRLTRLNSGIGLMLPLLMDKTGQPTTGVSTQDIAKALADGSNPDMGLLTAGQAAGLLQTLPEGGADPAKNRQWLLQMYSSVRAAAGQHEAALAQLGLSPTTRDTGQAIVSGGVAGPLTAQPGAFTGAGQPTQTYPSRAQLIAPQTYPTPGGTPVITTGTGFAVSHGQGANTGPAGAETEPSGSTPFPNGGRLPKTPSETMGPAPGTVEPQIASGAQYAADQRSAGTFGQRVFPLKQAIGLLSDTNTGPGTETLNQFKSFLISMSNQGLLPKTVTSDAINQANFDELRKYMSNYITNLPFAAGSDARMAEAVSGNPHANLSTIANQDLARVMVGLERFRQAQYLAFNQAHPDNPAQSAGKYGDFAATFATKYDPRAFAYDLIAPEARTKLYNSLSAPEQEKYRATLKLAYGLPGLMQ